MNIADVPFNEFCRLIKLGLVVTTIEGSFKYTNIRNKDRILHDQYWNKVNSISNTFSFQEFYSHLFCEQFENCDIDLNLISFDFTNMLQSELDELINK
jgi:hypothetical protein